MGSERKILFITGGNTGLGFETVKALAKTGIPYEIVIGCRTLSKGETAIQEVKSLVPNTLSAFSSIVADLESDISLEKAVAEIQSKFGRIDILINNGGGSFDHAVQDGIMSLRETFNKTWDTNVSGTHVLTHLAIPLLLKSSDPRLIFITSGTSSLTETDPATYPHMASVNTAPEKGWPKAKIPNPVTIYRSSKVGMNMLMREWYRILLNDGVKVWCVSPGFLATGLSGIGPDKMRKMGALEPFVGGEFIKDVVEGKRDADVGQVIRNHGKIQPW